MDGWMDGPGGERVAEAGRKSQLAERGGRGVVLAAHRSLAIPSPPYLPPFSNALPLSSFGPGRNEGNGENIPFHYSPPFVGDR